MQQMHFHTFIIKQVMHTHISFSKLIHIDYKTHNNLFILFNFKSGLHYLQHDNTSKKLFVVS